MDISFARTNAALLRGAQHLVVTIPKAAATNRVFSQIGTKKLSSLLGTLAKEISPGPMGGSSTTLTGATPRRLTLVVLPDKGSRYNSPARAEAIRRNISAANLSSTEGKAAVLHVLDEESHLLAAITATARALPRFTAKTTSAASSRVEVLAVDRKGTAFAPDDYVLNTAAAVRDSAELVDTPPTDLDPAAFAKRADALLKPLDNVQTKSIVGPALQKEGMNGIFNVGRCAVTPPRMYIATHTPSQSTDDASTPLHIALVGKGVTYDTGGLSLKPTSSMCNMKCDMGGAAAMLGAFRVLAATDFPAKVTLILCLAENAIGAKSYKPDDILTLHSGKTVEINNTDAEGRLLLADGVSYASRSLNASVVFDAAALTGAQMVATGLLHGAVVSDDADLEQHAVAAGTYTGDLAHPLPFAPELFQSEFRSTVADMRNSVKNRANAQTSCAAQFVYSHLDNKDCRWCHIDLAGPAFPNDRATGYGVSLVAETCRRLLAV